jgi:hypothetical protein
MQVDWMPTALADMYTVRVSWKGEERLTDGGFGVDIRVSQRLTGDDDDDDDDDDGTISVP